MLVSLMLLGPVVLGQAKLAPAKEIFAKMLAAVGKHKNAQGTLTMVANGMPVDFKFRMMYPNYFVLDNQVASFHGTGDNLYFQLNTAKIYSEEKVGSIDPTTELIGLDPLFKSSSARRDQPSGTAVLQMRGTEQVYAIDMVDPQDKSGAEKVFVDAKTFLPAGLEMTSDKGTVEGFIKDLKFDVPMKASDFAYTPPAGYEFVKDDGKSG